MGRIYIKGETIENKTCETCCHFYGLGVKIGRRKNKCAKGVWTTDKGSCPQWKWVDEGNVYVTNGRTSVGECITAFFSNWLSLSNNEDDDRRWGGLNGFLKGVIIMFLLGMLIGVMLWLFGIGLSENKYGQELRDVQKPFESPLY